MSERDFRKIGAGCAVAGGVLAIIFNVLHPRSGDIGSFQGELELIVDSGSWIAVHLGLLAAFLLVFVGVVAIIQPLLDGPAGAWARMALYTFIAAAPIAVLTLAVDGIANKQIADDWADAGDPDAALLAAEAAGEIGVAMFTVFIIVLFGVAPILLGVALLGSAVYPRWVGWLALVAGALGLFTGFLQAATSIEPLTANILFPIASVGFTVVVIAAGLTLWRRVEAPETVTAPSGRV